MSKALTGETAEAYIRERERLEPKLRHNLEDVKDEAEFQHLLEVATIKRLKDLGYMGGA